MESEENRQNQEREQNAFQLKRKGGLYAKVRMSVRTANILVAILALVLVGALIFVISHNGFTVNFETNGGTEVASVRVLHGETVAQSQVPTREGYEFTGWYTDRACTSPWSMDSDTVTGSLTLYGGWGRKKKKGRGGGGEPLGGGLSPPPRSPTVPLFSCGCCFFAKRMV